MKAVHETREQGFNGNLMQRTLTPEERNERERQRAERDAAIRLKNNRLGLSIFQGSWIMVFICLVVVNWQLGFSPGWRPEGADRPDLLLPSLATLALLVSTFFARQALKSVEGGQVASFLQQWRNAIGLGLAFFLIMLSQFFAMVPGGDGEQYVYMYRVMIGYHAIHALIIGYMMVQVWRYGQRGQYHAGNTWAVEGSAKLWYFVTVAWLMFYVVLYWL